MALTRKQIVTCISIVYLVLNTALAGYASSRASNLSIPIPPGLTGFATVLPILSGLILEIGYDLARKQEKRKKIPRGETPRPTLVIVANTIIFIYSTVVMTLLGTHTGPPSGLNCGLEERWRRMFVHKDEQGIRTIQDVFRCCGFLTSHDKAWPFPDKSHDAFACEKALNRKNSCFKPWKAEEQRLAGILMTVVGLVFVWQIAIIVSPTRQDSWVHQVLPDRVSRFLGEQSEDDNPRRAIDYLPTANVGRYSDRVEEADSDSEDGHRTHNAIENGVRQVRNALPGAGHDEERPHVQVENEWTRN